MKIQYEKISLINDKCDAKTRMKVVFFFQDLLFLFVCHLIFVIVLNNFILSSICAVYV